MASLNRAGRHIVTLSNCHWQESKSGNGYNAVLLGTTANGETVTHYMAATETIVRSGKNAGKSMWQVTLDTLMELGMPSDPTKLHELDGQQASFECEFETDDKGQPRLRVKFVNSLKTRSADPTKVAGFFARLGYQGVASQPAATVQPAADPIPDLDEIPF